MSKTFIKHRNMRDVSFNVWDVMSVGNDLHIQGLWYNECGIYHDPRPFPMGSGNRPAVETIKIPVSNYHQDWIEFSRDDT